MEKRKEQREKGVACENGEEDRKIYLKWVHTHTHI